MKVKVSLVAMLVAMLFTYAALFAALDERNYLNVSVMVYSIGHMAATLHRWVTRSQ